MFWGENRSSGWFLIYIFFLQGDGPKLVRELFRVAEEHAPSIVFIDEIDAVGTKRYDSNSGGEREIQRTMLELLNQLDGFDSRGDVKVLKTYFMIIKISKKLTFFCKKNSRS